MLPPDSQLPLWSVSHFVSGLLRFVSDCSQFKQKPATQNASTVLSRLTATSMLTLNNREGAFLACSIVFSARFKHDNRYFYPILLHTDTHQDSSHCSSMRKRFTLKAFCHLFSLLSMLTHLASRAWAVAVDSPGRSGSFSSGCFLLLRAEFRTVSGIRRQRGSPSSRLRGSGPFTPELPLETETYVSGGVARIVATHSWKEKDGFFFFFSSDSGRQVPRWRTAAP